MSPYISFLARVMRMLPFPKRLRSLLWKAISRWNSGTSYLYPVQWRGQKAMYGGVCAYSDRALLSDITSYEPESVKAMERILHDQEKPVIIDVGAHNGEWLFLFKSLCPTAELHAFEPFPALAAFLKVLGERNGWNDIHVEQALLGAESGEGHLHFAPGATDCASTVSDFQPTYNQRLQAPKLTIDAYVEREGLQRISLIKIDVEGGELEVLQGAKRTLERFQPPLLMELLFTRNPEHLIRQEETVALLRRLGYSFFLIEKDGRLTYQDVVEPDNGYKALNFLVTRRGSVGERP